MDAPRDRSGSGFEEAGTNVDPPLALRDHPGDDPDEERSLESKIDVVLVPWSGGQPAPGARDATWHYVQLWSEKRIYAFDLALTCVAVIDRASGQPVDEPQTVGAHLTGGQLIDGDKVKMVYPLPVPGTQGMLQTVANAKQAFVRTPTLERVIVRLVAVGGAPRERRPTWEAVAEWSSVRREDRPTIK